MHMPFFLAWDLIVHLAEELLLLFKAMGRDAPEPHAASPGYRDTNVRLELMDL